MSNLQKNHVKIGVFNEPKYHFDPNKMHSTSFRAHKTPNKQKNSAFETFFLSSLEMLPPHLLIVWPKSTSRATYLPSFLSETRKHMFYISNAFGHARLPDRTARLIFSSLGCGVDRWLIILAFSFGVSFFSRRKAEPPMAQSKERKSSRVPGGVHRKPRTHKSNHIHIIIPQ